MIAMRAGLFLLCVLGACGGQNTESQPEEMIEGTTSVPGQSPAHPTDPAETANKDDLGVPADISLYIPSREELDRRIRLAQEAAQKGTSQTVTTDTTKLPVVRPPDVVHLPERGPVTPQRPLHPRLAALLRHIERNDVRAAHREIKDLNFQDVAPQDRFLLQGLQAYIYFRLGNDETALELVNKLSSELTQTMPLRLRELELVEGPLQKIRFGRFRPSTKPLSRRGSTFYLYLEPHNVIQVRDGDFWRVSLSVNFTLKDSRGNVVHTMENINGTAFEKICNEALARDVNGNQRQDLYYAFVVPLPQGLNPMDYTLEVELTDLNTEPRKITKSSLTLRLE